MLRKIVLLKGVRMRTWLAKPVLGRTSRVALGARPSCCRLELLSSVSSCRRGKEVLSEAPGCCRLDPTQL